jgi:hypothetical protein
MDTERGDELVQLLRHLHHGVLTASDALTLGIACGTRRKPVLTQIMTRHCQQHGVKIDAAPEVGLVPFAPIGADVVDLMHVPPLTSTSTLSVLRHIIDETNKANQMRMNFAKRPSAIPEDDVVTAEITQEASKPRETLRQRGGGKILIGSSPPPHRF